MVFKLSLIFLIFTKNLIGQILITVPHGHCLPDSKERTCDKVASKAGKLLARKLNSKIIISSHYRENTDLNREESRPTKFRMSITPWLKSCRQHRLNCILLDVHSFPAGTLSQTIKNRQESKECEKKAQKEKSEKVEKFKKNISNESNGNLKEEPSLYFIKALYDDQLANFLYQYLKKNKIDSFVFDPHPNNDIILEATYYKIPSVLIEFRENLTDQELEKIINVLTQALQSYIQGE